MAGKMQMKRREVKGRLLGVVKVHGQTVRRLSVLCEKILALALWVYGSSTTVSLSLTQIHRSNKRPAHANPEHNSHAWVHAILNLADSHNPNV